MYADFRTGEGLSNFMKNINFTPHAKQLAKYPAPAWSSCSRGSTHTFFGFHCKILSAEHRLFSFCLLGRCCKYSLVNNCQRVQVARQAYLGGNVGADLTTASGSNGEFYIRALAALGPSILMSSAVAAAKRPSTEDSGIKLVVRTPTSKTCLSFAISYHHSHISR